MSDQVRKPDELPLVIDVDGTLLKSDLLHEAVLQFVAHRPLQAWRLGPWLASGKAVLKARLADQIDLGSETMPLRSEVVATIRAAQQAGRPIYLASASDRRWVQPIADRIGGITGVIASDGRINLAGAAKAAVLVERFGTGGFDYIGDAPVDLPVWSAARHQLIVGHTRRFEETVRRHFPSAETIVRPRQPLGAHVRALRPHQWAKNILVFLPMLAGHTFLQPSTLLATLIAFVAFCMAASSSYLINDLLDLPGDRAHPRKRERPFAAADLSVVRGMVMAFALMAGAILLSLALPWQFFAILIAYVVFTLAYSLVLKRKTMIDVIMLGMLYTMRVFGGVAASGTHQSQWLLMFSLFLFLSLGVVKRCSELVALRNDAKREAPGRSYRTEDLAILLALGASSGFCAVLVVTLYLSSPEVTLLYANPLRLWLICPLLLYWIGRILLLSNRGELHDDPVIFALTDRTSWLVGALTGLVIAAAI